ncbi:hypothetical protein [Prodigiosinella confusarubida]|uniref:hypothetical protein n=1 Tax=Serratia sp. (strain ATCC 39006) TaxID=104623 RepID=UPI00039253F9|nr:hypothetical protein [Serratia sp. ATCC 39006]
MSEGINDNLPDGATELSPDDLVGLIPSYIETREDLNEFEKSNIQQALTWFRRQKIDLYGCFNSRFLLAVALSDV